MKKKKLSRLTLHRETIKRLDEPTLRELAGGTAAEPPSSQACCPAPAINAPFQAGAK